MCSLIPKNYNVLYIPLYSGVTVCFYPFDNCHGAEKKAAFYIPITATPSQIPDEWMESSPCCSSHESYSKTCNRLSCNNDW